MGIARNNERTANSALARVLCKKHPDWYYGTVHAEQTGVIAQTRSKQPDILIDSPRRQPVAVETEFLPARTVHQDAKQRLGLTTKGGKLIEGALAVRLPKSLATDDLNDDSVLESAQYEYAVWYLGAHGKHSRWPPTEAREPWLRGGPDELADAIEYLGLSENQLSRGADTLEWVVKETAELLSEEANGDSLGRIAKSLHQQPGEQTERMAAAICVSAFVFHAAIEGQPKIPPLLRPEKIDRDSLLGTWEAILDVNYWPIFSVARNVLRELPLRAVQPVMGRIAKSLPRLVRLGATTYHDLTGRMFQTLITDRKFLATFYTLPESACLLAELAVERLDLDWSDRKAIGDLRIADFACGTGALLSAAQRAVYRRYRRSGGDDKDLHRALMERVLIGLDIMPAATHLTCSMLSSTHPFLAYGECEIHTLPYGVVENETHIGALDFLDSDDSLSLYITGKSMSGVKKRDRKGYTLKVPDSSCDLVIMNPPFTRSTNHEAGHAKVPVPSFAGFATSHDEQEAMSNRLKGTSPDFGHGNVGLASNFMDLGHRKLKSGGVLALVIPFAFTRGGGWAKARKALQSHYSDIHITAIASDGSEGRAFSADTGMAECLVVATKTKGNGNQPSVSYTNLTSRPRSLLEAAVEARSVRSRATQGSLVDAGTAGVRSASVIDSARELEGGLLRLPRQRGAIELPMAPLAQVAERGLVHRDINGDFAKHDKAGNPLGPARGPFTVRPILDDEVPTYPMLWAHSAGRERRFVVQPDRCGDPRPGDQERANDRWERSASYLHSTLDFQLNSQSLAMCVTPEKCLGGTAWPNVIPRDRRYEIPLLLWANSTLGLILFWWSGSRQQKGRARLTITKLPGLPVLDPRALTNSQVDHCERIFEEFKNKPFLPANEAYHDETRKALDRNLLFGSTSVLQLDEAAEEGLALLREQWCAEPSVHGGKPTRPGDWTSS